MRPHFVHDTPEAQEGQGTWEVRDRAWSLGLQTAPGSPILPAIPEEEGRALASKELDVCVHSPALPCTLSACEEKL